MWRAVRKSHHRFLHRTHVNLNKLQKDLKDKVTVVGIACNDTEAKLRKAIKDFGIEWTNYMETENLSSQYGITGYPTKILIDPNGKIVFRYDGEHENFYKEIQNVECSYEKLSENYFLRDDYIIIFSSFPYIHSELNLSAS